MVLMSEKWPRVLRDVLSAGIDSYIFDNDIFSEPPYSLAG
jgi:hypothetical protein